MNLALGDPWSLETDIGPVIDAEAQTEIAAYIAAARAEGRVLREMPVPKQGHFIAAHGDQGFGRRTDAARNLWPGAACRHLQSRAESTRWSMRSMPSGYGLTFGLHTRIDDRVQSVVDRLQVGNTYVNRNQIGAVVGSQPFGGEGLSGTGPKAGGPDYLRRFTVQAAPLKAASGPVADEAKVVAELARAQPLRGAVHTRDLPGPTGESNRLSAYVRPPILCLGPDAAAALAQAEAVRALGGLAVEAANLPPETVTRLNGHSGAIFWGDADQARSYARALAGRTGPILPLITDMPDAAHVLLERHVCVDTTASGGNAQLLAEVADA